MAGILFMQRASERASELASVVVMMMLLLLLFLCVDASWWLAHAQTDSLGEEGPALFFVLPVPLRYYM